MLPLIFLCTLINIMNNLHMTLKQTPTDKFIKIATHTNAYCFLNCTLFIRIIYNFQFYYITLISFQFNFITNSQHIRILFEFNYVHMHIILYKALCIITFADIYKFIWKGTYIFICIIDIQSHVIYMQEHL